MYCSYTVFIYVYSCTVHFLYCFPVILFIWLSLLCTCICCHIFSYDIHILCFSYAFCILCFSYTILFIYFSYAFHILYLSYTFRVIDTLFLVLVYLSYTFLFHILFTSYIVILCFTFCFGNCLYFHRIAVLCFSYHVIYSIHVISFLVSCLQIP